MAEIVCYVYIFHLTGPMSLHYLFKSGCSKFLPNTGFIYYSEIAQIWCQSEEGILLQQLSGLEATARHDAHCPRTAPQLIENTTLSLSWSEREMQEKCRRLSAYVHVHGTFRA